MISSDLDTRVGVLESRVDRVCEFLSGMYWCNYLEQFDLLQQRVVDLEKNFKDSIGEVKSNIDEEIESKVYKLEANVTEKFPIIVDKFRDGEKKNDLAKESFSVDMKDGLAQIKIRDKNIKEVSEKCLEGLFVIMKEYGNVSLSDLFIDCKDLVTLNFPSTFDISNVTSMRSMFSGCSSLSSLDLYTFNTSGVSDMGCMFEGCGSLSSLNLSTFNTSNVTSMYGMFWECSSLSSLDLSTFNTSSVTNMLGMFGGCSSLSSLNLSTFNTGNVTDRVVCLVDAVVLVHLIYPHLIRVMLHV